MESQSKDLQSAMDELAEAKANYDTKKQQASFASLAETEARNKLNQAQKAFDKVVADIRGMKAGDWSRPERSRVGDAA